MSLINKIKLFLNSFDDNEYYRINRMRPPGAVDEKLFMKLCVRCSKCIEICPYRVIKRSDLTKNLEAGTPYIYAEEKGCQLCMNCTSVCPTGALDNKLTYFRDTRIGVAIVDDTICLNHLLYNQEEAGIADGTVAVCNQCFNSCPLKFDAIYLEDMILPTITDKCTGCGICTESCPTSPQKAINILPNGMADINSAGYKQYLKRIEKGGR